MSIESQHAAAASARRRKEQASASPATDGGPAITAAAPNDAVADTGAKKAGGGQAKKTQAKHAADVATGGQAKKTRAKHSAKKADHAPTPPRRTCKLVKGADRRKLIDSNGSGRRHTLIIGTKPFKAAADWKSRPNAGPTPKGQYDDGLCVNWTGSGIATKRACKCCGNEAGNLQIYENSGLSYPNGNSWDDSEIVCGACKHFTYETRFQEG